MIEPCEDYGQYNAWMNHNFPTFHSSNRTYHVSLILKIKRFEDIGSWLSIAPDEWVQRLGRYTYQKYIEIIVDLLTIWHFTLDKEKLVPYEEYTAFKDEY